MRTPSARATCDGHGRLAHSGGPEKGDDPSWSGRHPTCPRPLRGSRAATGQAAQAGGARTLHHDLDQVSRTVVSREVDRLVGARAPHDLMGIVPARSLDQHLDGAADQPLVRTPRL